jgi:hypothetical protein
LVGRASGRAGRVGRVDRVAVAERHRALDHVDQLAHVARPRVRDQRRHRVARDPDHPLGAVGAAVVALGLEEVLDQLGDVVGALAQGRQVDADDAEPVEQVLAEAPGPDLVLEVAVGRRDDPDVDLDRLARPDPPDLALLEGAQQLGLEIERQLAELVEEQGPAVSQLEQALPGHDRAGEAALLVAEQLALDQVGRDRAAVEHDQLAALARRHLVDRLRHDLLAGPGLALDHDRGRGRRDLLDDRVDLAHLGVAADEQAEPVAVRREDLDLLLARVELDLALASRHRAARLEVGLADPDLVDERPVGRVQVDQDVARVLLDDLAVVARHRVVAQDDVVVVHRSDPDLVLVEAPLGPRIVDRGERAAPEVQGRAPVEVADLGRRNEVGELLHGPPDPIIAARGGTFVTSGPGGGAIPLIVDR